MFFCNVLLKGKIAGFGILLQGTFMFFRRQVDSLLGFGITAFLRGV